jgi:hypothetical protein
MCTTGDTAHIDKRFKFLLHTRQHGCINILHCCNDPCLKLSKNVFCFPVVVNNSIKVGPFSFLVINVCNHGEHYETSCKTVRVFGIRLQKL